MKEIKEKRQIRSKTYHLGGDKYRIMCNIEPMHWKKDGQYVDIDTNMRFYADYLSPIETPYDLKIYRDRPEVSYRSKRGNGSASVRLVALDGIPIERLPIKLNLSQDGWFRDFLPGFDLQVVARPYSMEVFKILRDDRAPRELTWEYTEDLKHALRIPSDKTTGKDNVAIPTNKNRSIEMANFKGPEAVIGNVKTYEVTERFTGRTKHRDPKTRIASWKPEFLYPVEIDASIAEEDIIATGDDGNEAGGKWYTGQNYIEYGAWRFISVPIPTGATIDAATLTLYPQQGGAGTATIQAEATRTPAAWANESSNGPLQMTPTTADDDTDGTWTATTDEVITVTSCIQELMDTVNFELNDDIRLGVTANTGINPNIYDYGTCCAARLNVDYTEVTTDRRRVILGLQKDLLSLPIMGFLAATIKDNLLSRREFFKPRRWWW